MAVSKTDVKARPKTRWRRVFTKPEKPAYEEFVWQIIDAEIRNHNTGEIVFSQKGVEFPVGWSQNAINVVSQKYFVGSLGAPSREKSLKQLIDRVVNTITDQGLANKYFPGREPATIFAEELRYILAGQLASFNSPVWFNIGAESRTQQASACFILSVDDNMESILNWYREEGMIFKSGSGSGINLSSLRASVETLSHSSGTASGPVSFMRGADSSAGTIRSGGKTRRAAKMVILNDNHPDVEDFIWCKAREEKKGQALAAAGFDMSLDGSDIYSIQYQNANNSVRVSDEFMEAAINDGDWSLRAVKGGQVVRTVKANDILQQIAQASWECADPGVQYDTTINHWHTTPNAGRINASNPCSEYMHIDDSACNLASINLLRFLNKDGSFRLREFLWVVEVMITAQEILVGYSEYPTKKITENARNYRQLGLGYANLGALLMTLGLPYDSERGRGIAATITALMTGQAYLTSARIAGQIGPFAGYDADKKGMLRVLSMHRDQAHKIKPDVLIDGLIEPGPLWDEVVALASENGVRNSQATVLAPTGTIGLMMDCDTTGIEPELALVKYKNLVGGGQMTFVNQSVGPALESLGYTPEEVEAIVAHIDDKSTIVGAPFLKPEDLAVFACSMGDNPINYIGHVKMMGAVQPFLSGAISKTVNMPTDVSVADVRQLLIDSWRLGVKAIAIYRDNCKVDQPLQVGTDKSAEESATKNPGVVLRGATRRELPRQRHSKTFRFVVAGTKGFVTIGEFDDGKPGEVFINISKQGSTLSGVVHSLAISISYGLQYGVPLKSYIGAFLNMSFVPSGITDDPDIKRASSLVDYIVRRLAYIYLSHDELIELGITTAEQLAESSGLVQTRLGDFGADDSDQGLGLDDVGSDSKPDLGLAALDQTGPMCVFCGNQTHRAGSCYVCSICGQTTGCG